MKHCLLFGSIFIIICFSFCSKSDNLDTNEEDDKSEIQVKEGIKILSYNLFLLDHSLPISAAHWEQSKRASLLGEDSLLKNFDVLFFQECFDNEAKESLAEKLKSTFPYMTEVIGHTRDGWDGTFGNWREIIQGGLDNGGVMIASKWPIDQKIQYLYEPGCDFDALSLKGFAYARINKGGRRIHLVNTHLQSVQQSCSGADVGIRAEQIKQMRAFVEDLNIPSDELLIYGGDFNITRDTPEYTSLIESLNVKEPSYTGRPYSYDVKTNTLAAYQFSYPENKRDYLDYVFVSEDHLVPSSWYNKVIDPISKSLIKYTGITPKEDYYWVDYSDHYPVAAYIHADADLPEKSLKIRKYDRVSLKSIATGKYVSVNLSELSDPLYVNANDPDTSTLFNIVNTNVNQAYMTLLNGKVRVECSERINYFFNRKSITGSAYYTEKYKQAVDLELEIVKRKSGDAPYIENGDIIALKDKSLLARENYLRLSAENGKIFLSGKPKDDWNKFEIKMNNIEYP